jgi:hypothetical protein
MNKQDAVLFVRLEPSLKQAVDDLAAENERSLSQQVRHLLRREVDAQTRKEKQ